MNRVGPPGSSGPAGFPPGRGFYDQWFERERESRQITPSAGAISLQSQSAAISGAAVVTKGPLIADEQRNNALLDHPPLEMMLQAAVTLGEKTSEGQIIEAVSIPWLAFLEHIKRNPSSVHEIDWRKWEEIIAGAYSDAGYSVVLTPRSADRGRDVIATKQGLLSVRYFDQVKAYSPGNLVKLDDVHAMLGVLGAAGNVSKGIITTTSDFAPGVYSDPEVQRYMPFRLDLRPKDRLLEWLGAIAGSTRGGR